MNFRYNSTQRSNKKNFRSKFCTKIGSKFLQNPILFTLHSAFSNKQNFAVFGFQIFKVVSGQPWTSVAIQTIFIWIRTLGGPTPDGYINYHIRKLIIAVTVHVYNQQAHFSPHRNKEIKLKSTLLYLSSFMTIMKHFQTSKYNSDAHVYKL
jgi:hypothetical protein